MQEPAADAIDAVEAQLAALFANSRTYTRRAAKLVHPDLQPSGLSLLRMLDACGPSRPSTIAEHLDVDRSAISRLIQGLEEFGLIERAPDPSDKRAYTLTLSAAGREGLARLHAKGGPLRQMLAAWDEQDIADLARLLEKLNTQGVL